MHLIELKVAIKEKNYTQLEHISELLLLNIFNSSDFIKYWKDKVGYDFKEIDSLVKLKSPNSEKVLFWCIAGGAVSNVMHAYLLDTEPVINDIDIFAWVEGTPLNPNERYFASDLIKFAGVERHEKYNIIYKEDKLLSNNPQRAFFDLVSEFDFNACMAYYIPQPNQERFFLLAQFSQFVKEQKLKIYNFHHPLSTLIRGIKKEKELNVKFEKGKVVEVLANIFSEIEIEKTHLGEKKKVELLENVSFLKPWFELDSVNNKYVSTVKNETGINYSNKQYYQIFSFFRLPKKQRDKILFLIEHNFFSFGKLYGLVNSVKVTIPDFNLNKVKELSSFMKQHGNSIHINPLFINQWISLISKIKKAGNLEFIGFCESFFSENFRKENKNYYQNIPFFNFKRLKELYIKQIESEKNNILVEPILIPKKYQNYFKELVTTRELKLEGIEMHHCVGGYTRSVSMGLCRIFKVIDGADKATLELRWNVDVAGAPFNFYIAQLKSIRNSIPSNKIKNLTNEFIKTLNNQSPSADKNKN